PGTIDASGGDGADDACGAAGGGGGAGGWIRLYSGDGLPDLACSELIVDGGAGGTSTDGGGGGDGADGRVETGGLPLCADGVRNLDETDADCGGTTCEPCASGDACAIDDDCVSDTCTDRVCE